MTRTTCTFICMTVAISSLVHGQSYDPRSYNGGSGFIRGPLSSPLKYALPYPRPYMPFPSSHPVISSTGFSYPGVLQEPKYSPYHRPRPVVRPGIPGPKPCLNQGPNWDDCYGPYGNGRRVFDQSKWNYMRYWPDDTNRRIYPRPYTYPQYPMIGNYGRNNIPQTYFRQAGFLRYGQSPHSRGPFMREPYGSGRGYFPVSRWFPGIRRFGGTGYDSELSFETHTGHGRHRYSPIFRRFHYRTRGKGYYDFDDDDD